MAISPAVTGGSPGEAPGVAAAQQFAREAVAEWSAICQRFLDWQRREVLGRRPSGEILQQHQVGLKWLLRFAKGIYATASDPEYPDKAIADELKGRVIQLEHSWRMVHEPMPEAEADQLLREVFPGINPELEGLVRALEAVVAARGGSEAARLDALYQARIDDVLARWPNLSRATLLRIVDLAHWRWLAAQQKPTSLPPSA